MVQGKDGDEQQVEQKGPAVEPRGHRPKPHTVRAYEQGERSHEDGATCPHEDSFRYVTQCPTTIEALMPEPRVVVTGIGVVSPFGVGRDRFWEHVSRGCSGTRAITDFDTTGIACRVAAPVSGVTFEAAPEVAGDGPRGHTPRAASESYSP